MPRIAKRSAVYAWIACLAILFSALAPTLSHAFPAASSLPPSMELCTTAGVKLVPASADSAAKSMFDAVMDKTKHCGNCMACDHFALIPPVTTSFTVSGTPGHYPFLFYQAHSTLFPWTVAQSRAPPAAV